MQRVSSRSFLPVSKVQICCHSVPNVPCPASFQCLFTSHQSNGLDLTLVQPGLTRAITSLRHLRGKNDIVDLVEADLAISGRLHASGISIDPNSREDFKRNIQEPFLLALMANTTSRLANTEVLAAFTIFDPSKLLGDTQKLTGHAWC